MLVAAFREWYPGANGEEELQAAKAYLGTATIHDRHGRVAEAREYVGMAMLDLLAYAARHGFSLTVEAVRAYERRAQAFGPNGSTTPKGAYGE